MDLKKKGEGGCYGKFGSKVRLFHVVIARFSNVHNLNLHEMLLYHPNCSKFH